MPHKHTRRKGGDDSQFDLAPSVVAQPLPANASTAKAKKTKLGNAARQRNLNGNDGYKHDDTPRAFARMMQLQNTKKRPRSGLDDGDRTAPKKKSKVERSTQPTENHAATKESATKELPKILPGERLGEFAARVDQAMPVGGLARKGKTKIEGIKERQTKTERRLQKMYAGWREEDARWKEKLAEREADEEEANAELGEEVREFSAGKAQKARADRNDDPWAELEATRKERIRLHDVAQAPPTFNAVPRETFKVKNGAKVVVDDVPTKAGSLKRREELGEARREVIQRYRAMMGKNG